MEITWKWSAHGGVFARKPHEEIAGTCREAGFDGIEGCAGMFPVGAPPGKYRKIYEANGVKIATFHLPFGEKDDAACFYECLRKTAVENMLFWMERASALGTDTVIMHPTTNKLDSEIEGAGRYLDALGRSLEEIMPRAESLGLNIALENMLPGDKARFGSRPEHLLAVIRRNGHARLKFCLDTGHALVSMHEKAGEFLEGLSPCLGALHLQDNAGDRDSHLAPGRGLVDWGSVFGGMAESGFSGYACIEAPPFAHGPDYGTAAWKKQLDETRALALGSAAAGAGKK